MAKKKANLERDLAEGMWEPDEEAITVPIEDITIPDVSTPIVPIPDLPIPEGPLRTVIEMLAKLDDKFDKTFRGHTLTRGRFVAKRRTINRNPIKKGDA